MTQFTDKGAFSRFARRIQTERRYIHSAETRQFFDAVLDSTSKRADTLLPTHYLWRAVIGGVRAMVSSYEGDYEDDFPFPTERMKPLVGKAREGRANPKGIPFLYLATHKEVAVAEVRPWKNSLISLGQFCPVKELKLINATIASSTVINPLAKPRRQTAEDIEEWVWGTISHAFSRPTELTDDTCDYVPTQVLAELFREAGFHGVGYASSYGEGHNIALFDPAWANHVNSHLVRVKQVQFDVDWDLNLGYEVSSQGGAS